jgi:hypothetical protein
MRIALWSVALSVGLVLPARAQDPPPYYAIRDVRIVTVAGAEIPRGTVVISEGVIAAVGPRVAVPPEAWVIDGAGLTVYPGFVDALSALGLPAAEERADGGGAGARGPAERERPAQGPEDRPMTTPWENAADLFDPEDRRVETWRKGGFTSVVVAPERGIFAGQAAWVNLGSGRANELVVKTPVALRLNLQTARGFRSFPGSLMGVIAYIEQVFLDADRYGRAWAAYESQPRGRERPEYDRALEPVRRAVAERWPVLLPGAWPKEIRRALALGGRLGVRTVVYGGHGAYELPGELAAAGVPLLVSAKWPERERDADPEADEPLRVLRFRDRAPSAPAALRAAGVPFAFYSDGLATPKEMLANIRKAIEAGLPEEAAVRALTLAPAEIYGVADRLGSIERGKIANLVVTDGSPFDEKTKVRMVFVDGRLYRVREPGRPSEPPAVTLTGRWTLTIRGRGEPQEATAELTQAEDGSLSGTVTGTRGTQSVTGGWVSGTKFQFTVTLTRGGRTVEATYTGTVEGDRMTGTVSFGPVTAEFTGERARPPEETPGGGTR